MAAVVVATWYGGFWPGLLTIVLSTLTGIIVFQPLSGSPGVPLHLVDVFRVTLFVVVALLINALHVARKRAERGIRDNEQRLSSVLAAGHVGCWEADLKAGTFWCSDNLGPVAGQTAANFGKTYDSFLNSVHPEDRPRIARALDSGKDDLEIEHRIGSGDGRRVCTRLRIFRDRHGNIERLVATVAAVAGQTEASPKA
jgi:PAS domain-containing protein